jgi:hypothetical protein
MFPLSLEMNLPRAVGREERDEARRSGASVLVSCRTRAVFRAREAKL